MTAVPSASRLASSKRPPPASGRPPRARKRRRAEAHAQARTRLQFDRLSDATAEHVVRFLSARPSARGWQACVPPEGVLALLRAGGSLAAAARAVFRQATLAEAGHSGADAEATGVQLPSAGVRARPLAVALLAGLCASLESLRIARAPAGWFVRAVARCGGLRRLSVALPSAGACRHLPAIVASVGGRLTSLELDVRAVDAPLASSIASHCRSLTRLRLFAREVAAPLAPVWRAVGARLQEVELLCPGDAHPLALPAMCASCPRIDRLLLSAFGAKGGLDAVGRVARHYGGRLRSLSLEQTPVWEDALRRLAEDCPRASVDVRSLGGDGLAPACALALGGRLRRLEVGKLMEVGGLTENLARVAEACGDMREVTVALPDALSAGCVRALFGRPLRALVSFRGGFFDKEAADELWGRIADRAGALERIEYAGKLPSLDALRRVAGANEGLRAVSITVAGACACACGGLGGARTKLAGDAGVAPGVDWGNVVDAFRGARRLERLDVGCAVRGASDAGVWGAACRRARNCGVAVSVCGFVYR